MAYARFGKGSDVYVYADVDGGYRCERCPGGGTGFSCRTPTEMLEHLRQHIAQGQRVPAEALAELEQEAKNGA